MSINKVIYDGNSLIDLTEDTVTPETLAKGVTAHDKSGAVITGTMESGGGGDSGEAVATLLENTMKELDNSIVTSLRTRACQYATALVTVNLPSCKTLNTYVFYGCTALTTAHFPLATSIPTQSFYNCTKLKHADFGNAGSIATQAFNACSVLTELVLRKSDSICTLSNVNAINNSAIGKGTGYIYVPSALVDSYKTATNWSTFANQFRALEDYTIDGTVTGELDRTKI